MVTLEIQRVPVSVGSWVGPRNLKSHRVVEIFGTGNVKTDCGKRFGPGNVVAENGTENHVMRCAECVRVAKAEPLPTPEIPRESGGKSEKSWDSSATPVKAPAAKSVTSDKPVSVSAESADKGADTDADSDESRAPRALVRSAEYGNPLVIGVSATGHYVQNQSHKTDYLSLCGRQIDAGKSGQRDKLCKRCEKFITHDELVTETERIAAEVKSERDAAIERENATAAQDFAPAIEDLKEDMPQENSVELKNSAKMENSATVADSADKDNRTHREALAAAKEARASKRSRTVHVDAIRKGKAEMPTASMAPTGEGAPPMLDGVATLPRGKMGTAGVRFDPEIIDTATVGGRYGWLTPDEFTALKNGPHGRSRVRNYWARVKKNRDHARALSADNFAGKRGNSGRAH